MLPGERTICKGYSLRKLLEDGQLVGREEGLLTSR